MDKQKELATLLINYEVKHRVNDTSIAFASHLSVDKVHRMKNGLGQFTQDEIHQIYNFLLPRAFLIK